MTMLMVHEHYMYLRVGLTVKQDCELSHRYSCRLDATTTSQYSSYMDQRVAHQNDRRYIDAVVAQ